MRLPWWVPFGRVPEITPGALLEMVNRKPRPHVVDVRTQAEYATGHVPGAVNVPVMELASKLDALRLDDRRRVIAICLTAHRSIMAVRLLRQRGFDAVQLSGGMMAWRAEKLPESTI